MKKPIILKPFFSYYGSKWRSIKKYPKPIYHSIIEPFAGSASYSAHYPSAHVTLYDKDPIICGIWDFLINAKKTEILSLPLMNPKDHVDDLNICNEAKNLIGFWLNKGTTTPCKTLSKWGTIYPNQFWSGKLRARIAEQIHHINHWKIVNDDFSAIPNKKSTWFVDPPYQIAGNRYRFGSKLIDYQKLGKWCKTRRGQTIVCENLNADWLPFDNLGAFKTSRQKPSNESIWINLQ